MLLLGLKQGVTPFTVHTDVGLGIINLMPVEQKALPPQFIMPMCGEPRHAMAQILDC